MSCTLLRVVLKGLPGHMIVLNNEDISDEEGHGSEECEREQRREVEEGDGDWMFSHPAFIDFRRGISGIAPEMECSTDQIEMNCSGKSGIV